MLQLVNITPVITVSEFTEPRDVIIMYIVQ